MAVIYDLRYKVILSIYKVFSYSKLKHGQIHLNFNLKQLITFGFLYELKWFNKNIQNIHFWNNAHCPF